MTANEYGIRADSVRNIDHVVDMPVKEAPQSIEGETAVSREEIFVIA